MDNLACRLRLLRRASLNCHFPPLLSSRNHLSRARENRRSSPKVQALQSACPVAISCVVPSSIREQPLAQTWRYRLGLFRSCLLAAGHNRQDSLVARPQGIRSFPPEESFPTELWRKRRQEYLVLRIRRHVVPQRRAPSLRLQNFM